MFGFPGSGRPAAGYEVFPVVDAVGGTSPEAHRAGLERIVQAGAQPIGWVSVACELQRDWARIETVPEVVEIVLTFVSQGALTLAARAPVAMEPGRRPGLRAALYRRTKRF